MQLFMKNVSFGTSEEQLYIALARLVHSPPVQPIGSPLLNFHIQLFPNTNQRSRGHKGSGLLTLPTQATGEAFLSAHHQHRLNGRTIFFQKSNKSPDTARIAQVASTPWRDPRIVRSQQENKANLSTSIKLTSFSFGYWCRDGVFSPEATFSGSVSFDLDSRRLVLNLPSQSFAPRSPLADLVGLFGSLGLDDFGSIPSQAALSVWYSAARISQHRSSPLSSQNHVIFLESEVPPTFVQTSSGMKMNGAIPGLLPGKAINRRISAPKEGLLLPPICRHVCLVFESRDQMDLFTNRSPHLHLPRPRTESRVNIIARGLYSPDTMNTFRTVLKSLPFRVAFEMDKSMWSGVLSPKEILDLLPTIQDVTEKYPDNCDAIFRFFASELSLTSIAAQHSPRAHSNTNGSRKRRSRKKNGRLNPPQSREMNLQNRLQSAPMDFLKNVDQARIPLSLGMYQSYHVAITPTTQVLEGPLPDQSNSLLRRFGSMDSFLRVSFQDEEGCKLRRELDLEVDVLLSGRYKNTLLAGLTIAGRPYEWLGYSMSGLKEHTFWFIHSPIMFEGRALNASKIRDMLGDFSKIEKRPALLGARWAQAFSTSLPSVTLASREIRPIPDIVAQAGGTNAMFTDGCSPISTPLSRDIWKKLKGSEARKIARPSSYQFRWGGAKGIIVEDPSLHATQRVLCLRPSQTKFVADGVRTLDITTTSTRPILCFLNRPLIAILEHHGVPTANFRRLQDVAIDDIQKILTSTEKASTLFQQYGLGNSFRLPSLFLNVVRVLGRDISDDRRSARQVFHHELLSECLVYGANDVLRDIKHRAHVLIPGSYTLIGVADEWNVLREGEIYAHVVDDRRGVDMVVTGRVLITRSPQIHPGDVQFCQAIGRCAPLAHLVNVVVFSCRGNRSLPSKLGGGDLDGDIYNLILEDSLFPPKHVTGDPGAYQALPHRETEHACKIDDVADFVTDFIQSDLLGYISILFLRIADRHGVDHPDCRLLAEKASHAVDYPKVGRPVTMKELPRPPNYELRPDFLSGEGVDLSRDSSRFYPSEKALGDLFRNVPILKDNILHADPEVGSRILDAIDQLELADYGLFLDLVENVWDEDDLMEEMDGIFKSYCQQLMTIARTHTISKRPEAHLSEAELVSGTIQEKYHDPKRRRETVRVMNLQTLELVNQIHHQFTPAEGGGEEEEGDDVTISTGYFGEDDDGFDAYKNSIIFRRAYAAFIVAEDALEENPPPFGAASFQVVALSAMLGVAKRVMAPTYQTRYV